MAQQLPRWPQPRIMVGMAAGLPLPTLLSATLVAFTVEFDNESEHRMPHRTTGGDTAKARSGGPWLVSQVMWSNVMRYVVEDGISVVQLRTQSRTTRNSLKGLQRWGYVVVEPGRAERATLGRDDELLVRPTAAGRRAQDVWRPLAGLIEGRWQLRFGSDLDTLRQSLQAVVGELDFDLPDYLPVVYPTQNGKAEIPSLRGAASVAAKTGILRPLELSALLSQVLLAFTLDFERESRISLPISANTLRVLDDTGVRIRDLPALTGVSKEANAMAVGFLARHGCVVVEPDPSASRGKRVRLTVKGRRAQDKYRRILGATEEQWGSRFGEDRIARLRWSLERLVGEELNATQSPLFSGLEPYPDGWRASVRRPDMLPHYPMVLHRGGYPDGS